MDTTVQMNNGSLKRTGSKVQFLGSALSNAHVFDLLVSVKKSKWKEPKKLTVTVGE
jgi:hypothetical protein